jgi:hypothetical protein
MLDLQDLPHELFLLIIEEVVRTIGIYNAVLLRSVSHAFNTALLHAICNSQVVEIEDEATPVLQYQLGPMLKGKIIANKSRRIGMSPPKHLAVVSKVNAHLDDVNPLQDHDARKARHEAVASAVYLMQNGPEGPDIDAQNLLCGAVIAKDLPLFEILLDRRRPLNSSLRARERTPYFDDPLSLAAEHDDVAMVQQLLDWGVRHKDPIQEFHISDFRRLFQQPGSIDMLTTKQLGDYVAMLDGADQASWQLNSAPVRGHTSALRVAIVRNNDEIFSLLMRPEYRLPVASAEYVAAIVECGKHGRIDFISALLEAVGKQLSELKGLDLNLLQRAIQHRQARLLQWLLDKNVDLLYCVSSGPRPDNSALGMAAHTGDVAWALHLIEKGAVDDDPGRPHAVLDAAARQGNIGVVQTMLDVFRTVKCFASECAEHALVRTAYASAARHGRLKLTRHLLMRYPDIKSASKWRGSRTGGALDMAIASGNLAVISQLVEEFNVVVAADDLREACGWHPGYVADHLASLRRLGTTDADAPPLPSRPHDERNEQYCTFKRSVMPSKRTWQWVSLC